jgi:hypothetical protein
MTSQCLANCFDALCASDCLRRDPNPACAMCDEQQFFSCLDRRCPTERTAERCCAMANCAGTADPAACTAQRCRTEYDAVERCIQADPGFDQACYGPTGTAACYPGTRG